MKQSVGRPPKPAGKTQTLESMFLAMTKLPSTKPMQHTRRTIKPEAPKIRSCPGLTALLDARIGQYLDHIRVLGSTGGGSRGLQTLAHEMFDTEFRDLDIEEKAQVWLAQTHGNQWRIDIANMSVFAAGCEKVTVVLARENKPESPCSECLVVYRIPEFRNIIRWKVLEGKNLAFIPHAYHNSAVGNLYRDYQGLQDLIEAVSYQNINNEVSLTTRCIQDDGKSILRRFVKLVTAKKISDDHVFMGLVETMVLSKEWEIHGKAFKKFQIQSHIR